jgi:hypothetical protein
MAELMLVNDLAIVPASTIAIEAIKSKMYLFTGLAVDNQENIMNGLCNYPQVYIAGDFISMNESQIQQNLEDMIANFKPICLPASEVNTNQYIVSIFNSLL